MRMARNIYHRKDGRFEGRYVSGYNVNGKKRYGSVFAKTYAECKDRLEGIKTNLTLTGQSSPKVKQSIKDAVTAYLESSKHQFKPSTAGIYKRYLEAYISPHFGNTSYSAVTAETSQAFVNKLIEKGLSAKTVQSVFSLLRKSVQEAGGDAWSVKLPKKPRHEVRFFTIDEQKRIEAAAKASCLTDYIAVTLCLYTGIRIGEVCGLQYGDIDFTTGTLHVKRTMQRIPNPNGDTKTKITFLSPKSTASERIIPLPDFITALLSESKTISDCDYIVSLDKKPVEPRTLQYRFKRICMTAGVKEVNFHITRHSFAVRALENGFDVKSLSEIMGHANAIITLNHYAHATDTQKRLCMNALSAVYSKT